MTTISVPPPTPHAHLVGVPPLTSILLLRFPCRLWVMMTTLPPAPLPPGADLYDLVLTHTAVLPLKNNIAVITSKNHLEVE